ncbi:MAG TPA: ATP synthase F1 subunit delta [Minicystis sp.]|nr:ATP synthase F1 subunit delta [Minicystis sp.]
MSYEAVARRWAHALFELGKETSSLVDLNKDVRAFADVYASSAELRDALDNPLVPEPSREAILVDVAGRLGVGETAKNTLRLLAQKRRLAILPDLARQLARLTDEDANLVRATVTSAAPLSDAYKDRLRAALEKATGKKVTIAHEVDPTLVAGVVTKIGDRVIDGSLKARLQGFRESLLRA